MKLPLPDGVFHLDYKFLADQLYVRCMTRDCLSDRKRPCGAKHIFVAHDLAIDGFVLKEARGSFHENRCCGVLLSGGVGLQSDSSLARVFDQLVFPSSA